MSTGCNASHFKSPMLLFLAAFIWGVAFVAQSVGMDYVGPWTFNACRFFLGGLALLPFCIKNRKVFRANRKVTLIGGICCGLALASASMFQQTGIMYTSVGKAGFITALYIIIVPLLGFFFHKKPSGKCLLAALLALIGFYLLCLTESFSLQLGDGLVLVCAVLFSFHILIIDHFSPLADGVQLSCIQFFTSGIVCGIGTLVFEQPQMSSIVAGWIPILYAGILSCGVAYTLQIIGQRDMEPTLASLILSLESVISMLAGWVILNQALSRRELLGCLVVFAAIILAQLPDRSSITQQQST